MIWRGPKSPNKRLEKLLKFMILTIGTWFLEDFLRAQFPPKENVRNLSDICRIFGPEIIDFWSPRGSRTPSPSRNFIYFLCCGPWILSSFRGSYEIGKSLILVMRPHTCRVVIKNQCFSVPWGSWTPGPSRNLIYFLCCGPWILTSIY